MKQKGRHVGVGVLLGAVLPITIVLATGTVFSEVKDNVAYVYHKDAEWNCCAEPHFEKVSSPDTAFLIDIKEYDFGISCNCFCYFDFTHTLEGLAPGTYTVRVWEIDHDNEPGGLAGTTSFVIPIELGIFVFSSVMSECHHEPNGVGEDTAPALSASLATASPIAVQPVELKYSLEIASAISLEIYNSMGVKVRNLVTGTEESGTHTTMWDACDDSGKRVPRGTYFALLETQDGIYSLPLIVLR